jgi:hypothetical protein
MGGLLRQQWKPAEPRVSYDYASLGRGIEVCERWGKISWCVGGRGRAAEKEPQQRIAA